MVFRKPKNDPHPIFFSCDVQHELSNDKINMLEPVKERIWRLRTDNRTYSGEIIASMIRKIFIYSIFE